MKHAISARGLANPHRAHSHFQDNFWITNKYLIHYQSEEEISQGMDSSLDT